MSPSASFTPGPWYLDKYVVRDKRHGHYIAECHHNCFGHQLLRANGLLISAAPDLLGALEAVNEWSVAAPVDDFPYPIVEAAIRNANGR
jgi:hypothetical protein